MHLSTVCQLALPADDDGRKASRHHDRIVANGHGRPDRAVRQWRGMTDRLPSVSLFLRPTLVWSPYESGVEGWGDARKSIGSL